jgi:2-oxoglutarate ferredoxin oxidoreductase subunit gamma
VVVGDSDIRTPPTVIAAWYAIGMHHRYWSGVADRLRPSGVAVIDSSVFRGDWEVPGCQILPIDATSVATDMGAPLAASMVAIGALAAATQLVGIDALMAAAYEVLPSYRATHAQANAEALRTGMTLFSEPLANAWAAERAAVPR